MKMAKIINKGKCAVKIGALFLIPNKTVEVDIADLKKNYPQVTKLIEDKILVEVGKVEVKK